MKKEYELQNNPEALSDEVSEAALLGSMFEKDGFFYAFEKGFDLDMFTIPVNQAVAYLFTENYGAYRRGEMLTPYDEKAVISTLRFCSKGKSSVKSRFGVDPVVLERIIPTLSLACPAASNYEHYYKTVRDIRDLNQLGVTFLQGYRSTRNPQGTLDKSFSSAERHIIKAQKVMETRRMRDAKKQIVSFDKDCAAEKIPLPDREKVFGKLSPDRMLNKWLNGHGAFPGELVIVLAEPKVGKTQFGIQWLVNSINALHVEWAEKMKRRGRLEDPFVQTMLNNERRGIFVSAEMPSQEILKRMLKLKPVKKNRELILGHISIDDEHGFMDRDFHIPAEDRHPYDLIRFYQELLVDKILDARQRGKENLLVEAPDFVIVDYAQIIAVPRVDARHTRVEIVANRLKKEVAMFSHGRDDFIAWGLPDKIKIPVILLAQIKPGDNRSGKGMDRTYYSRELGMVADTVIVIDRWNHNDPLDPRRVIYVEAYRHGPAGYTRGWMISKSGIFHPLPAEHWNDYWQYSKKLDAA